MKASSLSSCKPALYNANFSSKPMSLDGQYLNVSAVANPCGLIAKYYFNDTYVYETLEGE